jgi:hypothetical protein
VITESFILEIDSVRDGQKTRPTVRGRAQLPTQVSQICFSTNDSRVGFALVEWLELVNVDSETLSYVRLPRS